MGQRRHRNKYGHLAKAHIKRQCLAGSKPKLAFDSRRQAEQALTGARKAIKGRYKPRRVYQCDN